VKTAAKRTNGTNPIAQRMRWVLDRLQSAKNIDEIIISARDRILSLFNADKLIIYCLDRARFELFTRYLVGSEIRESRMAISSSDLIGYVAHAKTAINVTDVYRDDELHGINRDLTFDRSWDERTGYRTKSVMAQPIIHRGELLGVIALFNKLDGERFSQAEESALSAVIRGLGSTFQSLLKSTHPTRFSYLIEKGIVSQDDVKNATITAQKLDTDIETVLMKESNVSKKDIGVALSRYYDCKFVSYDDSILVPKDLVKGINLDYLKKAIWIPIASSGSKVIIAIDNPRDVKVTEIPTLMKSKEYEFQVALREDILQFIDQVEKGWAPRKDSLSEIVGELLIEKEEEEDEDGGESDENLGIVVRMVNQMIIDGFEKEASDIHVEPDKANKSTDIRFRIDGICSPYLSIPYNFTSGLISRIKIMSNLDISEKRVPQDGKIKFRYNNRSIELRVATVPSVMGENVVMRILASNEPLPLDEINLSAWNYANFREIIQRPYGIILVVGPTGSGKTTTLHSALGYVNTVEKKIWTAEDPVEITQRGLCQVEVKPKINYTFAAALRSFLRADPDVIMVGEMRDTETATIAIEASLTGHLVLSTLHTNSSPETVTRLIDMGIDPFNFADSILGILAQRLIRTFCRKCRESYHPDRSEFDSMVHAYGGDALFSELGYEYDDFLSLYRAKGCEACSHTGYRKRTALHELLLGTKELKMIIQQKGTADEIRGQGIKDGMRILHQDGIGKVFQGYTDYQQVRNVCMVQ